MISARLSRPIAAAGRDRLAGDKPVDEAARLVDQPVRVNGEPEELRQLPDQDRERKPVHVADLRRPREQVGDEPESRNAGDDHDHADQQGEHRSQGDRALGASPGADDRQDCGGDHGPERGVRAEDQDP